MDILFKSLKGRKTNTNKKIILFQVFEKKTRTQLGSLCRFYSVVNKSYLLTDILLVPDKPIRRTKRRHFCADLSSDKSLRE